MKICIVPTDKVETLCPDPRVFHSSIISLSICHTKEENQKALEKWNELCEDNKCPFLVEKPIKETEEAYWYNFPTNRYYIIRWLTDGGYHLYPTQNGKLPEGFETEKDAQNYINKWFFENEAKVVNGTEASKYPVPKRW